MADVPEVIQPFKRQAWKPITTDGDGSLSASKFSGKPQLRPGESWPTCQNCGKPMQLFLQLNLQELPQPLQTEFGSGLLQMFYCTSTEPLCEVDCEAFFPFAKSTLLRIVPLDSAAQGIAIPDIPDFFPPKSIIGWEEVTDYPNCTEGYELGLELSDSEWEALSEQNLPHPGDKLAGWPTWVQGVEYPDCPVCQQSMRLVFQLDSEDHLPYMFGDVGCGHITQCETHKDQLAFGWACG
jgi:uncharacterized protein YwqG